MKLPLLVITGAAGAGKTTVGRALAVTEPAVLSIDGDVLASGAAAILRRDYVAFWRYVISIAQEVAANGVAPMISCLCRPEQVTAQDLSRFAGLSMLAMTCDPAVRHRRAEERGGAREWRAAVDEHNDIDLSLRRYTAPEPHRFAVLDTTHIDVMASVEQAHEWVRRELRAHGQGAAGAQ